MEPQTESLTSQIRVKTQKLVKTVEIRRDNSIRIPVEIPENIFHPFFTTKPTGEKTGLELSLTGDIIAGLYSGTLKIEGETRAYTEFIITLPKL